MGPTRGDWLLVPAVFAANEGRYFECATLVEAVRSSPIPRTRSVTGMLGWVAVAFGRGTGEQYRAGSGGCAGLVAGVGPGGYAARAIWSSARDVHGSGEPLKGEGAGYRDVVVGGCFEPDD